MSASVAAWTSAALIASRARRRSPPGATRRARASGAGRRTASPRRHPPARRPAPSPRRRARDARAPPGQRLLAVAPLLREARAVEVGQEGPLLAEQPADAHAEPFRLEVRQVPA